MEARMLKMEDMVKNVLHFIIVVKGRLPARKSDILKLAMNKQSKDFQKVIKKVAKLLNKRFGLKLVGIKNGPKDVPVTCGILEATSYLAINNFRQYMIAMITPNQSFRKDLKPAILLLILSCSYMLDRLLDEDTIWDMLEKMDLANHICKKKEELRRFLKTKYVDPLYLRRQDEKDTDRTVVRYGWGIRSDHEFSKYAILKFVAQTFAGKGPNDFLSHISKIDPAHIQKIEEEDEAAQRTLRKDDDDNDASGVINQSGVSGGIPSSTSRSRKTSDSDD